MSEILRKEEKFHDAWASSINVDEIDVVQMNTALTAPEMRYITSQLGPLKGKKLLDVGCGLGEAAVYFALQGADVTASDLSPQMLKVTEKLAQKYNVKVNTHLSASENLNFENHLLFDVIYVGNLFHHVEIEKTILLLKKQLKPDGLMISWDPVAYNPIINVYRRIATEVRTEDEHPLKLRDIQTFKKHFHQVDVEWFWLFTLSVFILMAVVQRRNPNKIRFWKAVIAESESWRWLYVPLEQLDRWTLKLFPFLRPLCWNVVIKVQGPKT